MARKKTTRRGNGEGSIYQRKDGTWAAVLTVGTKPDGKPDRKFLYGKTRAEAATKLREAQNNKDVGIMPTSGNVTFDKWITSWLENIIRPGIEDRATYKGYSNYVYNHIIPSLGRYKIKDLTPTIIQKFLDQQSAEGSLDKVLDLETEELVVSHGPLSDTTVNGIRRLIIASLEVAVEEKQITYNPAKKTKRAKTSTRNKMNILNEAERKNFAEKAVKYKYYAAYMLTFCTGCRRGEILGLPWRNVYIGPSWEEIDDIVPWDRVDALQLWDTEGLNTVLKEAGIILSDKASVYIDQAVVENGRRPMLSDPKTELSKRHLGIPYDMVLLLIYQRRQQNKDRDRHVEKGRGTAKDYNREGLVFCTRRGGIIYPRNFTKIYSSNLASMGIKHIRFHDLRHMVATILLEEGKSINVVQEQLGHYDAGFTASRYGHVTERMRREASDQLGDTLAAARGQEAIQDTGTPDNVTDIAAYLRMATTEENADSIQEEAERVRRFLSEIGEQASPLRSYMSDYLEFLERKAQSDNITNVNNIGKTAARKTR